MLQKRLIIAILSVLVIFSLFKESNAQIANIKEWFKNVSLGLIRPSKTTDIVLIGGTATTTDSKLEIQGANPLSLIALSGGGSQCLRVDNSGYVQATGADCGTGGGPATTDDLPEGAANLYYTDVRVAEYINSSSTIAWGLCSNNQILKSNGSGWVCAADAGGGGTDTNWVFSLATDSLSPNTSTSEIITTASSRLAIVNATTTNIDTLHIYTSFETDSNTLVTNLNADLLDGQTGAYYLDWDNLTDKPATSTDLLNTTGDQTKTGGILTFNNFPQVAGSDLPTTTRQLITKDYADAISAGLLYHQPVDAASTGDVATSGPQIVDGYSAVAGNRILLKDEPTAYNNGCYVVAAGDWTRCLDYDQDAEVVRGSTFLVLNGTLNGQESWALYTTGVTVGVTPLVFIQVSPKQTLTFGNGLFQSGVDVGISGALTQDSTITHGAYDFNFNLTGNGDFRVRDSGNDRLVVNQDGNIGLGDVPISGVQAGVIPQSVSTKGLVVKGLADQNANLFELQKSDSTIIVSASSTDGYLFVDKLALDDNSKPVGVLEVPFNQLSELGYIDSPFFMSGEYQNYLLQTESFNAANWVKTSIGTVTANSATDPRGTVLAENIPAGSTASANVSQVVTEATTGNWTFSVWLKSQSGSPTVMLKFESSASANSATTTVPLTTNWKRYSITTNFAAAHTNKTVKIISGTNAIAAWGAQLEPTAYARRYSGALTTASVTTLTRNSYIASAATVLGGVAMSGALTGATTGAFSSAVTLTRTGLAAVSTDGYVQTNTTAATAGVPVQMSPRSRWSGTVWNTSALSSKTVNWKAELLPISGNPGVANFNMGYASGTDVYSTLFAFTSAGALGINTSTPYENYKLAVNGSGLFQNDLNILGNATSSHFAASELCLNNNCKTAWPSGSNWQATTTDKNGNNLIGTSPWLTTTSTSSIYIPQDLTIGGNATTTGSLVVSTTTFKFFDSAAEGNVYGYNFLDGSLPKNADLNQGILTDIFGFKDLSYILNTSPTDSPLLYFASYDSPTGAAISYNTTSEYLVIAKVSSTPEMLGEVETTNFNYIYLASSEVVLTSDNADVKLSFYGSNNNASILFNTSSDSIVVENAVGGITLPTTTFALFDGTTNSNIIEYIIPAGGDLAGSHIPLWTSNAYLVLSGVPLGQAQIGTAFNKGISVIESLYNDPILGLVMPNITFNSNNLSVGASIEFNTTTLEMSFVDATGYSFDNNITTTGHLALTGLTNTALASNAYLCLNAADEVLEDSTSCLISSRKYKHDIYDFNSSGLDIIQKLKPSTYYYNDTNDDDPNLIVQQIGLMAEDTYEVDIRLVGVDRIEQKPKTIKWENLTTVLVKAVQEIISNIQMLFSWNNDQDEKIKILEVQNQLLQTRLNLLENKLK